MPELRTWTYIPEPRVWCVRCGVHEAAGTLCPVCTDIKRHADTAVKMASMCRG